MSEGDSVSQRPCRAAQRLSRAAPMPAPTTYQSEVPRTEPSVPTSTVGQKDSCPEAER